MDLGQERPAALGPILVARADDLDGRDESPIEFVVVDSDFVLVELGEIGFQGEGRVRRDLHGDGHATLAFIRIE